MDNGTGCPHLRLDLVLDEGIEVDSPSRTTHTSRPARGVDVLLRGVRRQTRHVSGATRSSPVRSYWPLSSFWRRGQGWRLRQREAPPEAPLRPAPERGRSRPEGATAGSDGGAVLDAARPAPGRHDAGLSRSILELAERLHPAGRHDVRKSLNPHGTWLDQAAARRMGSSVATPKGWRPDPGRALRQSPGGATAADDLSLRQVYVMRPPPTARNTCRREIDSSAEA